MKAAKKTFFSAKEPKPRPTRREALEVRPLRNPDLVWYEDEGLVVLHIVRAQTRKIKLINLIVPLPEERKIELDKMGSEVWRLCDGETPLRTIAQTLAKKYQLGQREAEISVGQFFISLQRRGFVLLLKGDEVVAGKVQVTAKSTPIGNKTDDASDRKNATRRDEASHKVTSSGSNVVARTQQSKNTTKRKKRK